MNATNNFWETIVMNELGEPVIGFPFTQLLLFTIMCVFFVFKGGETSLRLSYLMHQSLVVTIFDNLENQTLQK